MYNLEKIVLSLAANFPLPIMDLIRPRAETVVLRAPDVKRLECTDRGDRKRIGEGRRGNGDDR